MDTILFSKMDMYEIINLLMHGGILAFPTDTVFGLACMMDDEAIAKVYEAKGRSFDKPLPMMCDSKEMVERYAHVSEDGEKLLEKLTPGALTLVFRKKENVSDHVTMGKDTIAVRIPDDEFILGLIGEMGKPLMVTSANISGNGSLLRWEDVLSCMDGRIDGIVCEDARGQSASSIIDMSGEELRLLREGPVSMKEIKEALL